MTYTQTRTCSDCNHEDTRELTEREAAFVELQNWCEYWETPCSQCGSRKCESVGIQEVSLTESLLDEWGKNTNLSVNEQDEEIILGNPQYMDLLLRGIESENYLVCKKRVLLEALCVILYDAIVKDEEYSDEENLQRLKVAEKVKPELIKRKSLLLHPDQWICDYIKAVIFPYLQIENPN